MCVAIALPPFATTKNEPTKNTLKLCWENNPHGAGYSFISSEDGKIYIVKPFWNFKQFYKSYKKSREKNPNSHFIVHFRLASVGIIDEHNCHPHFGRSSNGESTCAIAHNGTITGLDSIVGLDKDKNKDLSDTKILVDKILVDLQPRWYENIGARNLVSLLIGSGKLVILSDDNKIYCINKSLGEMSGDVWYSNSFFREERKRIITSVVGNVIKHNTGNKSTKQDLSDFEIHDSCRICGCALVEDETMIMGVCEQHATNEDWQKAIDACASMI